MKLLIAALLILTGCGPIHKAEKIHTLEMNNLLESYYETVWNAENNTPGERDSIINLIIHLKK